jgi:putative ABC transport system permease protein
MALSLQKALVRAQSAYYAQTHFADVFATATRAPRELVADIARLDGVLAIDARAMKSGLMNVPGLMRPATVRLVALPDDERRALNRIVIVAGRSPHPNRVDEAVGLKTFLDAAHIALGERLSVTIEGKQLTFTIVGAALSPEYVYVPSASPMPDDAHQGVLWAPRAAVETQTGLGGAFSAVSIAVAPGVPVDAVLAGVDRILARYGGEAAYGRANQVSHKFQQDRIERTGVMATILPPVFLAVAAGLVNLVLGRMVAAEREQIGLLKAFGYSDGQVAAIYLESAAVVATAGIAIGALIGLLLSRAIAYELVQYMRFPHFTMQFSWSALLVSGTVAMATAVGGSLSAVRRAVRVSPSVAMQPPAPASFRKGIVERLRAWRLLDQPTRMIARNLERFPARALATIAGLAVSVSLLLGSQFLFGSIDQIVEQVYYQANHWTDEVAFATDRDVHSVVETLRLPAALRAEPMRNVSARMRLRGQEQRVALLGIDDDAQLVRPGDETGRPLPRIGHGVLLSPELAMRLGAGRGDLVEIEITRGRRPTHSLPVVGVFDVPMGETAYIRRDEINKLMADGDLVSAVDVVVDPGRRAEFYRALSSVPQVVSAASRDDTVASFRSATLEAMLIEMSFFIGLATAIAFGVAYNISRIALADRARDLATLRVLGFGRAECAYILAGELSALAVVAAPLGLLGGVGIAHALIAAFTNQGLYLPLAISAHDVGVSCAVYGGSIVTAVLLTARRIWTFDLVSVLKTRE